MFMFKYKKPNLDYDKTELHDIRFEFRIPNKIINGATYEYLQIHDVDNWERKVIGQYGNGDPKVEYIIRGREQNVL